MLFKIRDTRTASFCVTRPCNISIPGEELREIITNLSDDSEYELEPVTLNQFLGTSQTDDSIEKPMVHNLTVYPSIG